MSGIFGVFQRNGKKIEEKTVSTMLDAYSYWKPDESNTWQNGKIALGHTMLWNTPESKYEHLPLEKDANILTMDARIDNRDELLKELDLPERPLGKIGDSEFILAAYKKWGDECPKYLLGDFAFAIWDKQKQQLFCARDHVGVKQFYYHITDDLFVFGNDLKGLVEHPNISKKINDEAVANYIVNYQLLSSTKTFFDNITKLPPAHALIITNINTVQKCYWKLEDAPRVVLPSAKDYANRLQDLLEKAVYSRIRSDYPITSHLSGGLDSSTIAVIAARKLQNENKKLLVFNWIHEPEKNDSPLDSEWADSLMIAEQENMEHHFVALDSNKIFSYLNTSKIIYGETIKFWYEYPVREAVQKRDSRTILSGWGGDELATYYGESYYSDLLFHGKFLKLFKELKIRISNRNLKQLLSIIYHDLVIPFVPKKLYCKMPKITCLDYTFTLVKKSFLSIVKEKERKKSFVYARYPAITIRKNILRYWNNGHIQSRLEAWSTAETINRVEYNYPLLDKNIIEFIQGVPGEYFMNKGIGRYLFRSAFSKLLPDDIMWNKRKSEPQRVQRLIEMTISAYNLSANDQNLLSVPSKYIDNEKSINALKILDSKNMDRESMLKLMDIETSLAILNLEN